MQSVEEQIIEIIKQDHYSNSKIPFTETGHRILSEVTIEVVCTDCNGVGYQDAGDVTVECTTCNSIGKQTITLKQAIERSQS